MGAITVPQVATADKARATTRAKVAAGGLTVVLVASLIALRQVRIGEAMISTRILSWLGTGADRFGTAVLVDADGSRAGFTIASGCSTALLAAPFLVIGALSLITGRVRPGRTLACVAVALVGVVAVNQLRFGIVGGAIHLFGFKTGYGQSHVLIGTLVSTLGLVFGLTFFVLAMGKDGRRDAKAR